MSARRYLEPGTWYLVCIYPMNVFDDHHPPPLNNCTTRRPRCQPGHPRIRPRVQRNVSWNQPNPLPTCPFPFTADLLLLNVMLPPSSTPPISCEYRSGKSSAALFLAHPRPAWIFQTVCPAAHPPPLSLCAPSFYALISFRPFKPDFQPASLPPTSRCVVLGASNACLVGENPTLLRCGIVGMRESMVVRLRPCMTGVPSHLPAADFPHGRTLHFPSAGGRPCGSPPNVLREKFGRSRQKIIHCTASELAPPPLRFHAWPPLPQPNLACSPSSRYLHSRHPNLISSTAAKSAGSPSHSPPPRIPLTFHNFQHQ